MKKKMTRDHLLTAEMYGYSYANYHDHLDFNDRYTYIMPDTIRTLERADHEKWPPKRIAEELDVSIDEAEGIIDSLHKAREVVDAENPAESFRNSVRQSVEYAVKSGLKNPADIEQLVTQICFRVSDLSYLLMLDEQPLSRYSRHFRKEPDVEYDDEWFEGEDDL